MKYSIYLARIEGPITNSDSRLMVRVLPEMEDINPDQLPRWPSFFRNELLTGKPGALVWVISNEEFTTGFVLGYANFYTWRDDYGEASIPKDLYDALDNANINLKGKVMNFADSQVTFWNENTLHFVERSSGSSIVAYSNGTIHAIRPEVVEIIVGSSVLQIKEEEIIISAKNVRIEGEVKLGKNPQGKAFVSSGVSGQNAVASKDVWC